VSLFFFREANDVWAKKKSCSEILVALENLEAVNQDDDKGDSGGAVAFADDKHDDAKAVVAGTARGGNSFSSGKPVILTRRLRQQDTLALESWERGTGEERDEQPSEKLDGECDLQPPTALLAAGKRGRKNVVLTSEGDIHGFNFKGPTSLAIFFEPAWLI
jgi:hypothetical protein